MNRILQADVILTLTAEQARLVWHALNVAALNDDKAADRKAALAFSHVVKEQCVKQGVRL